jgi:predicted RNA-binding protein (virulence factor B family)
MDAAAPAPPAGAREISGYLCRSLFPSSMLFLGEINTLTALRHTSVGMFLGDADGNDVLLPNKYVPDTLREGDTIDVFLYTDSEDRPVATTREPALFLNQFGYLRVTATSQFGAFLDWGLEKDLLVPFREQAEPLREGQWTVAYLRLDAETGRLVGSTKLTKFLETERIDLFEGEEVRVLVYSRGDIGYNVILDNRYRGLVFYNDVFQPLTVGSVVTGYVRHLRDDGGIDVSLQPIGYAPNVEAGTEKILSALQAGKGYLPLTDASEPALIYNTLGMSKKSFKKALGALYRVRKVRLTDEGVYLVAEE